MPSFRIGTELDFIHGDKIRAHAFRHRLNRADPVLRAFRHNAFFPGHQRHHRWPPERDDLVIDLPRQKAQRQANHTGAIAQHPFNGVVGFARVRRTQNPKGS